MKRERTIAVTGAAGGMGTELVPILRDEGCRVIGIDLAGAAIEADLSTASGRRQAVDRLREVTGGVLDGIVFCAGLSRGDPGDIVSVNYFSPVHLLTELREDLGRGETPGAVAVASIAILMPGIAPALTEACLAGDEGAARALAATMASSAYRSSKLALARRVRQIAHTADWAGSGIRLNAVVPGPTDTPMATELMADPQRLQHALDTWGRGLGRVGRPAELAHVMAFLVGPLASYVVGQVIYVDGGGESAAHQDGIFGEAGTWAADARPAR